MAGVFQNIGSADMGSSVAGVHTGHFILQKGTMVGIVGGGSGGDGGCGGGALGNVHFDNWVDSGVVADHSQQTDTSTDTDEKNQVLYFPRFPLVLCTSSCLLHEVCSFGFPCFQCNNF